MTKTRKRVLELADELARTARQRYPLLGDFVVAGPFEGYWKVNIVAPEPIAPEFDEEVFAYLLPRLYEIFDTERIEIGVGVVSERFASAWAA